MLREKAKTPAHGDGYLEMELATQEADGDARISKEFT